MTEATQWRWRPASDRAHVGVVLPTREALHLGAAVVSEFGRSEGLFE